MLRGLAGNDRLVGNAGADVLTGGAGADVFDIDVAAHSVGGNRDVLRGGDGGKSFDGAGGAAGDRIDLSGIDANTAATGNQAFGLAAPASAGSRSSSSATAPRWCAPTSTATRPSRSS